MKKELLPLVTALFALLIVVVVVAANTGRIPKSLERLYDFPDGDKAGHFLLFGMLGYLLNLSALRFYTTHPRGRVILVASLLLSTVIGLEEWSQALFPARTQSLTDLLASYAGVTLSAMLAYRTKI